MAVKDSLFPSLVEVVLVDYIDIYCVTFAFFVKSASFLFLILTILFNPEVMCNVKGKPDRPFLGCELNKFSFVLM